MYGRADALFHYPFVDSSSSVRDILISQAKISPLNVHRCPGERNLQSKRSKRKEDAFCKDHTVHLHELASQEQLEWVKDKHRTVRSLSRTQPHKKRFNCHSKNDKEKLKQRARASAKLSSSQHESSNQEKCRNFASEKVRPIMEIVDTLCEDPFVLYFLEETGGDLAPPASLHIKLSEQQQYHQFPMELGDDHRHPQPLSAYERLLNQLEEESQGTSSDSSLSND